MVGMEMVDKGVEHKLDIDDGAKSSSPIESDRPASLLKLLLTLRAKSCSRGSVAAENLPSSAGEGIREDAGVSS